MKRILLVVTALVTLLMTSLVRADDVEYRIESYKGNLVLQDNGDATFTQEVTYYFDSSYNGQYVTLGAADPVPKGYAIDGGPSVKATVNGIARDVSYIEENLTDGKQLKVYNAGDSGDRVVLTVTWQIHHILSYYSDIAELNWFPISDWDEAINNVEFTVTGLKKGDGQLYAHTGFFGQAVEVTSSGDSYTIQTANLPSKGKLELHAYWPSTSIKAQSQQGYLNSGNQKDNFLATEANIQRKTIFYQRLIYWIVPALAICFLLVSLIFLSFYYRSTQIPKLYKDARLYEVPQDLAPLLLTKNIYKQTFAGTGLGKEKGQLSFDNMVQATILDLIDRGNLTYNADTNGDPTMTYVSQTGLASFEKEFLFMLFDRRKVVKSDQLFERYKINEKALEKQFRKAKTEAERNRIRKKGNSVGTAFSAHASSVDKEVGLEEDQLGLPNHYRELSAKEKEYLGGAGLFCLLFAILIFGTAIFLGSGFGASRISNILFGIGATFTVIVIIAAKYISRRNDYCLDKEHLDTYNQWRSFENMVASIDQFKQAELESVTVWNRILVYATLYGQAKRVSKVLKKYDIHLTNETLDDYVYSPAHFVLLHQATNLQSYVAASETVSHFSTSSNSGSGGFSGGGFSGGGGGGGGGAF